MCDAQGEGIGITNASTSRKRARVAEGDAATANVRGSRYGALCAALDSMSQRSWPGFCACVTWDMPIEQEMDAWLGARDGTLKFHSNQLPDKLLRQPLLHLNDLSSLLL